MLALLSAANPSRTLTLFGVQLVSFTAENGAKLGLTLALVMVVWLLGRALRALARLLVGKHRDVRSALWSSQAISILVTMLFIIGFLSPSGSTIPAVWRPRWDSSRRAWPSPCKE